MGSDGARRVGEAILAIAVSASSLACGDTTSAPTDASTDVIVGSNDVSLTFATDAGFASDEGAGDEPDAPLPPGCPACPASPPEAGAPCDIFAARLPQEGYVGSGANAGTGWSCLTPARTSPSGARLPRATWSAFQRRVAAFGRAYRARSVPSDCRSAPALIAASYLARSGAGLRSVSPRRCGFVVGTADA